MLKHQYKYDQSNTNERKSLKYIPEYPIIKLIIVNAFLKCGIDNKSHVPNVCTV